MERLEEHPDKRVRPSPVEVADVREMAAGMRREYLFEIIDVLAERFLFRGVFNSSIARHRDPFDYLRDQIIHILAWEDISNDYYSNRFFLESMAMCDVIRRCEWLVAEKFADYDDDAPEHQQHGWATISAFLHNRSYQFRRDGDDVSLTLEEALTDYIKLFVEKTVLVEFSSPIDSEDFMLSERDVYGHSYLRKVSPARPNAYPPSRLSACAIDSGVSLKGVNQAIGSSNDVLVTLTNSIPDKQLWVGAKRQDALGIVRLERDDLDQKLHLYLKDPPA